jgi:hypothetical protein
MGYCKLVDKIANSAHRKYHPYIRRKSTLKKWIHLGFMFFFLGVMCTIYNINFYMSIDYLNCIDSAHQKCKNIETTCHIIKYEKTICTDRYMSRLKPRDLVTNTMDFTYYDVYSERYPKLKYVANMTFLTHNGIVNDNDPTYKCYHDGDIGPQIKCDFTHQCATPDVELSTFIIMYSTVMLMFVIPIIVLGVEF